MRPMVTLHILFSASEHPIPVAGHCYMGLVAVVSAHSCGRPEFFQLRDVCSTLKRMLMGKEGTTRQISGGVVKLKGSTITKWRKRGSRGTKIYFN